MKVSIVIPTVRPQKIPALVEAIKQNAGMPEADYEVLVEEDVDRIGAPKMVKRLVEKSKGQTVCYLGDDTLPMPGFLRHAMRAMADFPDGWGLVALNDGHQDGAKIATHWVADKKLLQFTGGDFFCTEYLHCYCDKELTEIAKELDRYVYVPEAEISHDHPMFNGGEWDDDYKRAYNADRVAKDWKTYVRRKKQRIGFKLGIALPIAGRLQDKDFWLSFFNMKLPANSTLLVPSKEIYDFKSDIAGIRNDLVAQALEHGCSHLLMMDTDQIYPPDAANRLLAHEKDVVGAQVHRRYPPFAPIMYRGRIGEYKYVPDEEMYSGKLVEVDATGCGCVLYNTGVFLHTDQPWYQLGRQNGRPVGEDIFFHDKLRSSGYRIYVDTSVEVGHISTFVVNKSTYELFKQIYPIGDER